MEGLMAAGLRVTQLRADSNASGVLTLTAANGSSATARQAGDTLFGSTTLHGFLPGGSSTLAVLEFESGRWGYTMFLGPDGKLSPSGVSGGRGFRKGIGRTVALLQPRLDPALSSEDYYAQALADPADRIKREMENASAFGEVTFSAAAAFLAPTHDYALVGNAKSHTKFSVAQDGKVWLANFSIFSATDEAASTIGGAEPGALLFNPQNHLSSWPPHGNFSEYKTSIIGRYTRAIALGAWDVATQHGFALTVVPNTARGILTQPYGEEDPPQRNSLACHCSGSPLSVVTTVWI